MRKKAKKINKILSIILCIAIISTSIDITCFAETLNTREVLSAEDRTVDNQIYATDSIEMNNAEQAEILGELEEKRTENTKTFLLENGNELLINSLKPIHYEGEDGWEEISYKANEEIKDTGEEVYTNIGTDFNVELPKNINEDKRIILQNSGYELSYKILGIEEIGAKKQENINRKSAYALDLADSNSTDMENYDMDELLFEEAYENTDLKYILSSNGIKENIIIKQMPTSEITYKFEMQADGMQFEQNEDGSIIFYAEDDTDKKVPKFNIDAPYMYDANGLYSEDIKTKIEMIDGKILLSYLPSIAWMAEEEIAYPVTIDPIITKPLGTDYFGKMGTLQYYDGGSSLDGYRFNLQHSQYGVSDIYFQDLHKNITPGLQVVNASLKVFGVEKNINKNSSAILCAYTMKEAVMPQSEQDRNDNSIILDYCTDINNTMFEFDITPYMSEESGDKILGICIDQASTEEYIEMKMCHPNISGDSYKYPVLAIEYKPLDSDCKTEIDLDEAGIVSVDDFTGNIRFTRSDMSISGNRMPVTIGMNYNAARNDKSSYYGINIRNSYAQTITQLYNDYMGATYGEGFEYCDENGIRYYFTQSSDGKFRCESESSYELTALSDGSYILEKKDHTYRFNDRGRLVSISDRAPTVSDISIYYDKTGERINYITDGVGRRYNYVYDENNRLIAVRYAYKTTSYNYRDVNYTYNTDGTLKTVQTPDGKLIQYSWNNGQLSSIINYDKHNLKLKYKENKVLGWTEGIGENIIEEVRAERTKNQVIYTNDKNHRTVLQFDVNGNTISTQDENGNITYGTYNEKNQLKTIGMIGEVNKNYFQNASFENGTTGWYKKNSSLVNSSQEDKFSGYAALKLRSSSNISTNEVYQNVNLEEGKQYIFSAYIKTDITNAGNAFLFVDGNGITQIHEPELLTGHNNWKRVEIIVEASQNTTAKVGVKVDGILGAVFADALILEEGTQVSEYNLIENANFDYVSTTTQRPSNWTTEGNLKDVSVVDGRLRLNGNFNGVTSLKQTVQVQGVAGDEYSIGGTIESYATIAEDKGDIIKLRATIIRAEEADVNMFPEDEVFEVYINKYTSGLEQRSIDGFTTSYPYSQIVIEICYGNTLQASYFDDIELYKKSFNNDILYNKDGEVIGVEGILESGEEESVKDEFNRITQEILKNGNTMNYEYDSFNNQLSSRVSSNTKYIETCMVPKLDGNYIDKEINEAGKTTKYNINSYYGNISSIGDGNNKYTYYGYRSNNDLSSVYRSVNGLSDKSQIRNDFTYDESNNLSTISSNGTVFSFSYDEMLRIQNVNVGTQVLKSHIYENDLLKKEIFGNGQELEYVYDNNGNLQLILCEGASLYKFYNDISGNLLALYDYINNQKIEYRLLTEEASIVVRSLIDGTVLYSYCNENKKGNEETVINTQKEQFYDSIYKSTYKTDSQNKIIESTYTNEKNATSQKMEYNYDDLGRVVSQNLKNKAQEEAWDSIYNVQIDYIDIDENRTTDQISKLNYALPSGLNIGYSYAYDNNGNIMSDGYATYSYDEAGQLIRENNFQTNKSYTYHYNAGGNLVKKNEYSYTTGTLGSPTKTIAYKYDTSWADKLISYDQVEVVSDHIGNITSINGWNYTWTNGRLLQEARNGDENINYTYNQDGLRISKTVNGSKTEYIWNEKRLIGQKDETHTIYFIYDDNQQIIGINLDDEEFYYIKNIQGDVLCIVDKDGLPIIKYTYDAWGAIKDEWCCDNSKYSLLKEKNPIRYHSYYYDVETELYYLQSRYYNPDICRFINADDVSVLNLNQDNVLQYNLFAYCLNNPINVSDQNGYLGKHAWNSVKWVGRALNVILIVVTLGKTHMSLVKLRRLLSKHRNKIVKLVRGKILKLFGSTVRNALYAVLDIAMTIAGESLGNLIAKALDYADGWWGYRRNNGYILN